jgi:predicted dehydrogenase
VSPDPSALRVGMIGGGFMATVHSRAARAAGATLTTLASSNPQKAERAAAQLGFTGPAPSAEAIFADPQIDVVHICTPNATHAALALAAIQAGKHVICEKPLAVDGATASATAERAIAAGIVATVPFVYRFHPMAREARARVLTGAIGAVSTVHASYLQDWLLDADDDNWRVDAGSGGNSRAFADIGSHLVDMIEFVTGLRIDAVCAVTKTVHPTRGGRVVTTEDLAAVLLRFNTGAVGTLIVSQVAAGHANDLRIEVFGEHASVRFVQESPETLSIGRRGSTETLVRDATVLSSDAARLCTVPPGHPMGYQDAFNAFVRDSYAAIRGTAPDGLPLFADGARANELTDAVLASAATSAWVEIAAHPWLSAA